MSRPSVQELQKAMIVFTKPCNRAQLFERENVSQNFRRDDERALSRPRGENLIGRQETAATSATDRSRSWYFPRSFSLRAPFVAIVNLARSWAPGGIYGEYLPRQPFLPLSFHFHLSRAPLEAPSARSCLPVIRLRVTRCKGLLKKRVKNRLSPPRFARTT